MAKTKERGPKRTLTGIIEITRKGTGYFAWPEEPEKEDIEIKPEHLGGAFNGDTVEVELTGLQPRPKGKVVRVVSRAKEEFVATIKDSHTATASDARVYREFALAEKSNYTPGEKVLVRLLSFDGKSDPKVTVVQHLGRAGEHKVEMNSIVLEHGFRTEFPGKALDEARAAKEQHEHTIKTELEKRTDFRGTPTFTIDPADAKDFDDALSFIELEGGECEVGIHIADVTHFVRPDTALEEEAVRRGTSVYLVDSTIPMLPEDISNGIASLRPDEDRLAFSAIFRMNDKGEVLDRRFEKTVIRSQKRFTYEEAQKLLDSGGAETLRGGVAYISPERRVSAESVEGKTFIQELGRLRQLARIMRKKREHQGAIDFGDNEVKFTLDPSGKPLRVVRKQRIETMLMIEEFMLLANREVARYISDLAKKVPEKNMVFLYRVHDEPKEDRIQELATFVRAIGYEFGPYSAKASQGKKNKKRINAKDIAKLLEDIEGKPEEHLIRTATLRSMAKAVYTTKNIGHFGLAFEYYTHFTSPIRRYPDMLVHRILASHLDGKPITRREYGHLEKLCIEASAREAEAVSAERESIKYKLVEYMSEKIGQEFDAVISGVTDWGLYVEDKESSAEGLVRISTIGKEFFAHNKKEYALVGERTKKKYALGDKVKVKLIGADLEARTLDFELVR